MDDDRQVAQESVATQKVEVLASNRGEPALEARWLNRAIKDALEDDEVREALNRHSQGKHPKPQPRRSPRCRGGDHDS